MIEPSILSKYLAGDATDEEAQLCEELLNQPSSVEYLIGELEASSTDDSLLETLRSLENHTTQFNLENAEPKSLVEQIQSLVANQPVGQDEFDRILSPPQSSDEIGRIAHYRVIEFIASGGMGLVFKAEDSKLNRLVCIKVLNPALASNRDAVARFAKEVQAAAKLRNTRITTVLEFGEYRELPYLAMELLEGQSLRDKLTAEGKFAPAIARKLTIQIAEGLRYAHQRGYLHRDIKPENVWVTPEGDIKLLDFGLARSLEGTTNLTRSGTILGTPTYMSPEQVQGKELNSQSDLFSVGTVLFEMLTGESPFGKSNLFSTMMSVANDTLTFPDTTASNAVPDDLQMVIQSLLKKSPEDRLESADQLIMALTTDDGPALLSRTKPTKSLMNPWVVGAMGAVIGAGCLAMAFLLYQLNDKGTLIVEADSSIKVSIANEEVSIEDPQTGKKYDVVIGKTPLPSGVYQLQMTDTSGDYTLSSNVITIRRGEEQIVRVELKPSPGLIAKSNKIKDAVDPTPIKPALTLAELPTLSADELKRKLNIQPGDALFRNSIVSKPKTRSGVTSWSIETAFETATYPPRVNSDGSRIATHSHFADNKVTVWNRGSQPTHIIPAQDKVLEIVWSPHPDIIAVVENGKRRKQVTVWKLFEDHLEVIDVMPSDGLQVAWSWDGLLLSVRSEQEISFIDLSKGSVFAHPNFGIQGAISQHPWSANGRYFATTVEANVKVWDLEERKLLHIFSGKKNGQFLPEGNQIAVKEAGKWEIWDLDSFVRLRTIEPESNWFTFHPCPRFEKLAIVTKEGNLVLKDLETETTAICEFELDPFYTKNEERSLGFRRSMKLNWAHNGLGFVCSIGRNATFVSDAHREQGNELNELVKLKKLEPFSRKYVPIDTAHRTRAFDLSVDSQRLVYRNDHVDSKTGAISGFDFAKMKHLPATEISILEDGSNFRISPNGKMVAIVGSDIPAVNGVYSPESLSKYKEIRVCSVDTGKLIKTIETEYVREMLWSPDSSSLIVSVVGVKELKEDHKYEVFLPTADKVIEKLDGDRDGKLNKAEGGPYWDRENVDEDKDGFLSRKEVAKMWAARNRRRTGPVSEKVGEVETRIINFVSGDEIQLQAVDPADESSEGSTLCFQRGTTDRSNYANPVLCDDQIVLPIFDASTYRNGRRLNHSYRKFVERNDKLGFFDLKTGKLTDLVDLNCEFTGNRLAVSNQLILIGAPNRIGGSSTDSFIVFDRMNANEAYLPLSASITSSKVPLNKMLEEAQKSKWLNEGFPHLSPKHPYVAVASKEQVKIWKLDSENSTFTNVKTIRITAKQNRGGPWHPTLPMLAWIDDGVSYSYRVDSDQRYFSDVAQITRGISATSDGWIVMGSGRMVYLDENFKARKSYLSTERFVNFESYGKFDQCIGADGKISNSKTDSNLRVIQLQENRIETLSVEVLKN